MAKKTLKLKRAPTNADGETEGGPATPAIAERFQPPVAEQPKGGGYKVTGTMAILTLIMFLSLIALQFLELNFYAAPSPRSVWPTAGMF